MSNEQTNKTWRAERTTQSAWGAPQEVTPAPPVVLPKDTAHGHLSNGYASIEQEAQDNAVALRRAERDELAARFKENAQFEQMLRARAADPVAFERSGLGSGMHRAALAQYEKERNASKRTGPYSKEAMDNLKEKVELQKRLRELEGA